VTFEKAFSLAHFGLIIQLITFEIFFIFCGNFFAFLYLEKN